MKKIEEFLFLTVIILTAAILIGIMPTEKDAAIYEDTIRLHILANSDTEDDQALKYAIRDKLLCKYGEKLSKAKSPEAAECEAQEMLHEIERDVENWILEAGYQYGADVTLGVEWYDTREYETFTMPKGYYTSLKIEIGSAEGQNWWCVAYPPLCLNMAIEDAPCDDGVKKYSDSEFKLITDSGYNVKFKVLELVSSIFS